MSGLITLLSLSAVMAVASFVAGILPLSISLSRSQLRLISMIGMGVLVGTSLIVIIPEGVETLYTSNSVGHTHDKRSLYVPTNHIRWTYKPLPPRSLPSSLNAFGRHPVPPAHVPEMPGVVVPDSIDTPSKTPTEVISNLTQGDSQEEAHHAWIGIALITGFILMFLVDKLPQYTANPKPKTRTHISLNNLGGRFNLNTNQARGEEAEMFLENGQALEPRPQSFATTIGLVIHAAADGIALGASSSASNTNLSLVIFFAIMVHKAPAAFGLTSVLLRQGLSKRLVRAHLVIFSLAAPTGALLTWVVANMLGASTAQNADSTKWWTGILLLFSAGTFLYVAMHSMQEVTGSHQHEPNANGSINGNHTDNRDATHQNQDKPALRDLGAAVFGMVLPLFLQVGHAH